MEKNVGKYASLYGFLLNSQEEQVTINVGQIEEILGFSLPPSASKHRPWWANTLTHSHAKSWLLAGWEVDSVNLGEKTVFRRISEV
ncbi:DUF7662 domain-containing protein [Paenibacillus sp. VTT E-133280]|uniref:DUF7662 domain-containing protein n=1 Tax=Paenibacillus sp. VTT E-133280 TaxID=1986222 RepID=UPI003F8F3286